MIWQYVRFKMDDKIRYGLLEGSSIKALEGNIPDGNAVRDWGAPGWR